MARFFTELSDTALDIGQLHLDEWWIF